MGPYRTRILQAKQAIQNADYILIGAGAGLSTAAGLEYSGENFEKNYADFIARYGFSDLYSASFYPFRTQEEKWAFWARLIEQNRCNKPLKLYQELRELVQEKEYFVLTTNVDAQFEIAGFEKERIFAPQGDYAFLQCANACHNKLYCVLERIEEWQKETKNLKIPSTLVPKCPVCGKEMEMNLRKDANFVQDATWYQQAKKYEEFLDKIEKKNVVLLEIGVGFNTPGIIRFPFEQMTMENINTTLIRMNQKDLQTIFTIQNKMIPFQENIQDMIQDLKEN